MPSSSVRVAIRVRPMTDNGQNALECNVERQQIILEKERGFRFDYVYSPEADQEQIYNTSVVPLLNKFLEGYNSTIFAYGQTGSGKTYSMGIDHQHTSQDGIIPRFIYSLFENLHTRQSTNNGYSCQVCVSFLELHNEDLIDLLNPIKGAGLGLTIREDGHGNINWHGVHEEIVYDPAQLLEMLQKGSINRKTAYTSMNSTSSRSHAIFSVSLKQSIQSNEENRQVVSKFHFVDLAGSERLKRTHAVGDRAKEGISINSGLLALGNVISALGDPSRRVSHIPYRDSKLTRLLQDSLGGNSQTLMLACVSPAASNAAETLNTLKYANRARNIRNTVRVNAQVESNSSESLECLKAIIIKLKEELRGSDDFLHAVNDEMDKLKLQVISLTESLYQMEAEVINIKYERDCYKRLAETQNSNEDIVTLVSGYVKMIDTLRIELSNAKEELKKSQFLEQKRPAQIQHDDSSATLVVSPSCESTSTTTTTVSNNNSMNKKKCHIRRFESKRTARGTSGMKTRNNINSKNNNKRWLQDAKRTLESEIEYIKSIKVSIVPATNIVNHKKRNSHDNTKNRIWTSLEAASIKKIDQNKLIDKLEVIIETKSILLDQFEQTERTRDEQYQQLNKSLADLNAKKTALISQHKQAFSDQKNQYESRIKKQVKDYQLLRRKHTQLIRKLDRSRSQNQSAQGQLKSQIEKLVNERKKQDKTLKQQMNQSKEKSNEYEKVISNMKRLEIQLKTANKKLDHDLSIQKIVSEKATEQVVVLNGQLKKIAVVMKKLMQASSPNSKKNQKNSSDIQHDLLTKIASYANTIGLKSKQQLSSENGRKSIHKNIHEKKRLISEAISLYVQRTATDKAVQELYQKSDRLIQEQQELLSERQFVLEEEAKTCIFEIDSSIPQYMDERIDFITLDLDSLSQLITQFTAVKPTKKYSKEEADMALEIAQTAIRSLASEEAHWMAELLLHDFIQLKKEEHIKSVSLKTLHSIQQSLQSSLVQMRRFADQYQDTSEVLSRVGALLNSLFSNALKMPIHIQSGLVLPK